MRNWLAEGDFAQLELRIVALLAGDEPLLKTFAAKEDPHAKNAADIFGLPPDQITKSQRDFAKTFVYGANYGATSETLWKNILVEFPDAGFSLIQIERLLRNWFKAHPAIRVWQQAQLACARKLDKVVAPLSGHELFFYGIVEPSKVFNYPVQHTAADIINPVTRLVCDALDWPREGILAQVHDALVIDGPDLVRLYHILKSNMTTTRELAGRQMTFEIDVKVGHSWGDAVEVKNEEALARLLEDEQGRASRVDSEHARSKTISTAAPTHASIRRRTNTGVETASQNQHSTKNGAPNLNRAEARTQSCTKMERKAARAGKGSKRILHGGVQ